MTRILTIDEISELEKQGCRSAEWSKVYVSSKSFSVNSLHNVYFSGEVYLGSFDDLITLEGGINYPSGIYNAVIHNCTIGDNVLIKNVPSGICNYDIADHVIIKDCHSVICRSESMFGNGTKVSVLNEVGGREIPVFENMSSHIAYILTLYRHRPLAIENLCMIIDQFCEERRSKRGAIDSYVYISHCGDIYETRIGAYARLTGVAYLEDGTIVSEKDAPVFIGTGVTAKHFIVSSGTEITEGAIIDKCFIGQGCQIGKQYSAENSVFFANCVGMHGEACSIFAGPYTVTHHKATLLIAGYFSFMNAGSGSNQSNHMYKLGPLHQGIVERGSKTSSDSYLLWPARIGAFSIVMGRHYKHADTSDLPFSYLIEKENKTYLTPGANIRSVGTIRDAKKWQKRDKRKGAAIIDQINFNLLSPYTIQKMEKGENILETLKSCVGETSDFYSYQSARIKAGSLEKGLTLYRSGIVKFLGNSLISRIGNEPIRSKGDLLNRLRPKHKIGTGNWVDIAGLIAPQSEIERLLDYIESGDADLIQIQRLFEQMHQNYYEYEWIWAADMFERRYKKAMKDWDSEDLKRFIREWIKCVVELDQELYIDAKKEFTLIHRTGFGVDGGVDTKDIDFSEVRGDFERNSFVVEVKEHIRKKKELGENTINLIQFS